MARNIHLTVGSFLSTVRSLDDDSVADFAAELRLKLTDREASGIVHLRRILDELDAEPSGDAEPPSLDEIRAAIAGHAVTWDRNDLAGSVLVSTGRVGAAEVRRRTDKRTGRATYDARVPGIDADGAWHAFTLDADDVDEPVEVVETPGRALDSVDDDGLRELIRNAAVPWENLGVRDGGKWSRAVLGDTTLTRVVRVSDSVATYEVRRGEAPPYPLSLASPDDETRRLDAEVS